MYFTSTNYLLLISGLITLLIASGDAIRCFQCSSGTDGKYDTCGAYRTFDKDKQIPVECNSEDSHMPGSFCMKMTQQGPIGFIWDPRWRQVIRRCASVAETGVTGVCNWGVFDNGDYWEECYCSEDLCNSSNLLNVQYITIILSVISTFLYTFVS